MFITSMINILTIGTFGYSVVQRLPLPFLSMVKRMSVFKAIERTESVVVLLWVLADFVLLSTFTYVILDMIKSTFGLNDSKPLINIFLVLVYISALFICRSRYELEALSVKVQTPTSVAFGTIIPTIIFIIGKIKKKI